MLLSTVADVIEGAVSTQPLRVSGPPEIQQAVDELSAQIAALYPGLPNARWLAIRILDGDARVQQALLSGELNELAANQRGAEVKFSRQMAIEGRQ